MFFLEIGSLAIKTKMKLLPLFLLVAGRTHSHSVSLEQLASGRSHPASSASTRQQLSSQSAHRSSPDAGEGDRRRNGEQTERRDDHRRVRASFEEQDAADEDVLSEQHQQRVGRRKIVTKTDGQHGAVWRVASRDGNFEEITDLDGDGEQDDEDVETSADYFISGSSVEGDKSSNNFLDASSGQKSRGKEATVDEGITTTTTLADSDDILVKTDADSTTSGSTLGLNDEDLYFGDVVVGLDDDASEITPVSATQEKTRRYVRREPRKDGSNYEALRQAVIDHERIGSTAYWEQYLYHAQGAALVLLGMLVGLLCSRTHASCGLEGLAESFAVRARKEKFNNDGGGFPKSPREKQFFLHNGPALSPISRSSSPGLEDVYDCDTLSLCSAEEGTLCSSRVRGILEDSPSMVGHSSLVIPEHSVVTNTTSAGAIAGATLALQPAFPEQQSVLPVASTGGLVEMQDQSGLVHDVVSRATEHRENWCTSTTTATSNRTSCLASSGKNGTGVRGKSMLLPPLCQRAVLCKSCVVGTNNASTTSSTSSSATRMRTKTHQNQIQINDYGTRSSNPANKSNIRGNGEEASNGIDDVSVAASEVSTASSWKSHQVVGYHTTNKSGNYNNIYSMSKKSASPSPDSEVGSCPKDVEDQQESRVDSYIEDAVAQLLASPEFPIEHTDTAEAHNETAWEDLRDCGRTSAASEGHAGHHKEGPHDQVERVESRLHLQHFDASSEKQHDAPQHQNSSTPQNNDELNEDNYEDELESILLNSAYSPDSDSDLDLSIDDDETEERRWLPGGGAWFAEMRVEE
ncbi:unnamed protein product [Amoebophrya sp. A25]|nr:unnamed protein product [Amoebophrya sp. A25]|eukprot:GSA25T00024310001.1